MGASVTRLEVTQKRINQAQSNTTQRGEILSGRQSQQHTIGQPRQILAQLGPVLVAFALEAVVFQTLVAAAAVIGAPNKSKKTGHPRQL